MANGKTIPIEQIKVGDQVASFDAVNKQLVKGAVKKLLRHQAKGYLIINGRLKVTPEHRVYSDGKWKKIGSLKVGDNLFTSQGQPEKIIDIKKAPEKAGVYNFHVQPFHTYIAGGYVVHNVKLDPLDPTEPPCGGGGQPACL